MTYEECLDFLAKEGSNHIAYYHYTRWSSLAKMMRKVEFPNGEHRLLYLTRASLTNDGIEGNWSDDVFMACFSHSRYEDVAMWLNYGKYAPDAVRVKFDRNSVERWLLKLGTCIGIYGVSGDVDNPCYEPCADCYVKDSLRFSAVAYVIPSDHWLEADEGVSVHNGGSITQNGNVECGRRFFRISKGGDYKWVDRVYSGKDLDGIEPVFKKRGWAYEREVRLIVKIVGGRRFKRIAIHFDEPLDELERCMRMTQTQRESTQWLGTTKIWDKRFPLIQSGPWFDGKDSYEQICGFNLSEAFASEYMNEIKIFRS